MDNNFFTNLPTTPWAIAGYVVKARRERLGLRQEELKAYGGPGVSTVGKVERAAQDSFPLRTQHALENALGWERGAIENLLGAIEMGDESWWGRQSLRESYLEEMVDEDIPDLSAGPGGASPVRRASELSDDELLAELTYRMKRYAIEEEGGEDGATQASQAQKNELEARRALKDQEVSDEDESLSEVAHPTNPGQDLPPGESQGDEHA